MEYNFQETVQGDTMLEVQFELKDGTGAAIDLTDYSILMHVRKKASPVSDLQMVFTTGTAGTILITAPATDGKFTIPEREIDLEPYDYVYDMKFTNTVTNVVRTYLRGTFPVIAAVTY